MNFNFTIIMATYNSQEWIKEAIESLINQTLDFKENVQLIIVDDGSKDNTKETCQKYLDKYPKNIEYHYQENKGQAEARNKGLQYKKGKYINFLDSDDKLKENALEKILMFFKKHDTDLVSIPLKFFDGKTTEHILNYKYNQTKLIDLKKEETYIQLSASSSFIKNEAIEDIKFDKRLITSEDALFVNKILIKKQTMGVIHDTSYYYRQRKNKTSTTDNLKTRKEYYIPQVKYFIKAIQDYSKEKLGHVPRFIQYLTMYTLQWIYETPQLPILNDEEKKELHKVLKESLENIEDNIILSQKHIPENLKYHILLEKHQGFQKEIQNNTEYLKIENTIIDTLGAKSFWIDIIEIRNNQIYISGYLPSFFPNKKTKIIAINNQKEYIGKEIHYPTRNTFSLEKPIEERLHIDFNIPLETKNIINFKIRHDIEVYLPIQFSMNAKLSRTSHYTRTSYKNNKIELNKHIMKNIDNAIIIEPYTHKKYIKLELLTLKQIYKKKQIKYKEIIIIRIIYFILINTIYKNKKIWLFMDRKNTAKDNGEHLFKYATKKQDKIKKYFIIEKESEDYKKLKKHGKIIKYKTIKHKILFLLADKIISSQAGEDTLNPYWGEEIHQINGLQYQQYIFLQHGIINEDLSSWLKKCDMNLTIFTCSAQKEHDSIFKYNYNYNKETVKLLGLPRYDALENTNLKNQILLAPSWRHQFSQMNNNEFKQTAYYKNINKLINDEKLLKYLKEKNYKLIFKPHPQTQKFIHLFEKNPQITIDEDNKLEYTELLNQSKLLITDHSSIFYDFSYLKKPIIHYLFKNDIPKIPNKKTEFNFEKEGFGEITNTHEELMKQIKEYIETNCKIKEKYEKRIEKFYMFHDKHNRKRNYNAIMELYKN